MRPAALALLAGLAAEPSNAAEPPGPHALTDLSQAVMRAYNADDAPALHGLLAPALQARVSLEALRETLVLCRVLTRDWLRLSLPSWGARHYGFFGIYAEGGAFEMVLEIDEAARIRHLLVTDDLNAGEQPCRLGLP